MTQQLASAPEVVAFTNAARHYCRLLDEHPLFQTTEHFTIADLYSAAVSVID